MAQDEIQSLKIEISKNAKLQPYERIAFHKLLGIVKSENGMRVLLKELGTESINRESAVCILKDFNFKEVHDAFSDLLSKNYSEIEKFYILDHFEHYGAPEHIQTIIEFIKKTKDQANSDQILQKAFKVLQSISGESETVYDFLISIASNNTYPDSLRSQAILSLSCFKNIARAQSSGEKSFLEQILNGKSNELIQAAYRALSLLTDRILKKTQVVQDEKDELFTFSSEQEDKSILDIRVLIGKMTSHFDSYSNENKIAFIDSMIMSYHRELLIYIMKALTSDDPQLIDMTLDVILNNIQKIRDTDKLFRNLIALSIDSPRGNELIVDIFYRFFSNMRELRKNIIFKDKLYNYIVVTLETYFETYRKDFMIPEVSEKNFPENFQRVRYFLLEKLTPNYKRQIMNFLRSTDTSAINSILSNISKKIPFIKKDEEKDLALFLEIIFEKDAKSREISAARLDDLNYDKRYLRERIARLCRIIGLLKIDTTASQLVIIYNYVKKYADWFILDNVTYALSMLNYSYMLGELEVQLTTGDTGERLKAIQYLSLFSDQRSLNIILDYLKQNPGDDPELTIKLLNTLLKHDIFGNVSADKILKAIIETSTNEEIKRKAILCLGKCGSEPDIAYLDKQFQTIKDNITKESIVQSIECIISHSKDLNIRQVKNQLQEYLKDPAIRVRIYSCFLLIKLGDKNALRLIRDMMTIKNKSIQRDIITILGNLKSVEFAYYLISLLGDEYAIASDIVPIIELLPAEELKEIDHFITNIFKKYEYIGYEKDENSHAERAKPVRGLLEIEAIILNIEIINFKEKIKSLPIIELTMIYKQINELIISELTNNKGIITRITEGRILSYFSDPQTASETALSIFNNFYLFNLIRLPDDRINISIQLFSNKIKLINEEIINLPEIKINLINSLPNINRIIIEDTVKNKAQKDFFSEPLSSLSYKLFGIDILLHELISPINFLDISYLLLVKLEKETEDKIKKEKELENELKKHKGKDKSPAAIAYAQALDDIGRILKNDLNDVSKYIQKRSTDRELINNVEKMLGNVYKRYFVEKSKIFIEIK